MAYSIVQDLYADSLQKVTPARVWGMDAKYKRNRFTRYANQAFSLFRYYGGKGLIAMRHMLLFPNDWKDRIFIDTFCGSLSMPLNIPNKNIILNDKDMIIVILWEVLQNWELLSIIIDENGNLRPKYAKYYLYDQYLNRAEYFNIKRARERMKPYLDAIEAAKATGKRAEIETANRAYFALRDSYTAVEKAELALSFLYCSRTSRNGSTTSPSFGWNLDRHKTMFRATWDWLSTIDKIIEVHNRISPARMLFLHDDANNVIERYIHTHHDNTFLYLDPPYHWGTRTGHRYPVDFNPRDYDRFLDLLIKPTNLKMFLVGYNHESLDVLIDNGWTRGDYEIRTITGTGKPKIRIESFWVNYSLTRGQVNFLAEVMNGKTIGGKIDESITEVQQFKDVLNGETKSKRKPKSPQNAQNPLF